MNSFQHHKSPTQCNRSVISIDQHVVWSLANDDSLTEFSRSRLSFYTMGKPFFLHCVSPAFLSESWKLCAQAEEQMRTFLRIQHESFLVVKDVVNEKKSKKIFNCFKNADLFLCLVTQPVTIAMYDLRSSYLHKSFMVFLYFSFNKSAEFLQSGKSLFLQFNFVVNVPKADNLGCN